MRHFYDLLGIPIFAAFALIMIYESAERNGMFFTYFALAGMFIYMAWRYWSSRAQDD